MAKFEKSAVAKALADYAAANPNKLLVDATRANPYVNPYPEPKENI